MGAVRRGGKDIGAVQGAGAGGASALSFHYFSVRSNQMILLKQSSAATIPIGPFVDSSDGNTVEDGLTISQADVRLSKNGGNMAQKNESSSCSHDELGYYMCDLDTTDTNTLGRLRIMVHESGALPVWIDCMVVPANTFDSMVSGTDYIDAEIRDPSYGAMNNLIAQWLWGDNYTFTPSVMVRAFGGDGENLGIWSTLHLGSDYQVLLSTDAQDLSASLDVNTKTFESDLDLTATMKSSVNTEADTAISDYDPPTHTELTSALSGLNDPTAAAIADAIWDEAKSGHTAGGSFGEEVQAHALTTDVTTAHSTTDGLVTTVDTVVDSIKTVTDNLPDSGALNDLATILTDTNELQTDLADGGRIDLLIDAIVADTNELQTDIADGGRIDLLIDAIVADTNELQTDITNGGRVDLLIDAILADTNELQTDWHNGGRLDLILDAATAAGMVTELMAHNPTAGSGTVADILAATYAYARGKISKSSDAYTYYDDDDTTPLFVLTIGNTTRTTA